MGNTHTGTTHPYASKQPIRGLQVKRGDSRSCTAMLTFKTYGIENRIDGKYSEVNVGIRNARMYKSGNDIMVKH